jgi:8-amino-7-oxononanoate synthase
LNTLHSNSPIIPVLVGKNDQTMRMADALKQRGLIAGALRPPTVPPHTARLRLTVTLAHSEADLEHAATELIRVFRAEGLIG